MIPIKNFIKITPKSAIPQKSAPPKAVQVAPETMMPQAKTPIVSPDSPITIEVKDIHGKVLGTLQADYRIFTSGNKGYNISGKIPGQGADRLQVSGNVVIIGSKNH